MNRDHDALLDILEMIELIREHTPSDEQVLSADVVRQAATLRWIHIIGEASNRLSAELRDAHPEVPWRKIIDLRNLVAHAYDVVRIDFIWQIVQTDIPELERQVRAILEELE